LAKHFIAGQLKHARGMSAVLAPLVNSYKRLVPGYEAPVYISWARVNRSALIRIPRAKVPAATRLELRCPDPSCNPYLAFAVMLKCGLDGIKRELPLPAASEEDLYESVSARRGLQTLPGSLHEALTEMDADPVVCEALGPHILERFRDAKMQEWDDYRLDVSDWELKRYLSIH
jgi:glutamine synthetase